MTKGDIVWAIDTKKHFHPIVFINRIDESSFEACILSSKSKAGNLLMQPNHFHVDGKYSFTYKTTHLVTKCTFIKMNNWVNSRIVGHLTEEGIEFVERNIDKIRVLHEAPIWELEI